MNIIQYKKKFIQKCIQQKINEIKNLKLLLKIYNINILKENNKINTIISKINQKKNNLINSEYK